MKRPNTRRVDDELLDKDLRGRTYIVTGANSGVGLETTRQLVRQGAHVVMACRRTGAGEEAALSFGELSGSSEIMRLDLASLRSVRDFVRSFQTTHQRLDGLVCNAGPLTTSEIERTEEGFEVSMGVNYFGHFLLTELLLDQLRESAPSRIILLSSAAHAGSPMNRPEIHMEDLHYHRRTYNSFDAHAEAKLANVLYAGELGVRLGGAGVFVAAVHPGWARSGFGQNLGAMVKFVNLLMTPINPLFTDSNEDSAQTSLYCLLSDDATKHSGAFFSQSSVLYRDLECKDGGWPMRSPNPHALDIAKAKELVSRSYEIVGFGRPI